MKSKLLTTIALLLIVAVLIVAICTRTLTNLWEYSVIFCAFMSVFSHLMALMLVKMSGSAARKLDYAAMVFGVLAIILLIVVYILDWC
ncbi:MAG: hypothetical protein J1E97_02830 [Muribaculaceae bacterium]|nr:hypothetical protein [Muribaculaceae bacterium]